MSDGVIGLIIGLFLGGAVGTVIMSVCAAAGHDKDQDE